MADMGIFMKFDPVITGPVKLKDHDGWIEVHSLSFGSAATASHVGASAGTANHVRHSVTWQDIQLNIKSGKYTAEIWQHFFNAKLFGTVTVDMVQQGQNAAAQEVQIVAHQLVLKEAYLTSVQDQLTGYDSDRVLSISLSFASIDYSTNGPETSDKKMSHFDVRNTRAAG